MDYTSCFSIIILGLDLRDFYIQVEVTFKQQKQIKKPQWFLILLKKIKSYCIVFGIYLSFPFALNYQKKSVLPKWRHSSSK